MENERTKCQRCKNCEISFEDFKPYCELNIPFFSFTQDIECEKFNSIYIEYPLTIEGIDDNFKCGTYTGYFECGSLVKVQPCGEEYKGRTYLGILLGNLPIGINITFSETSKKLKVSSHLNPAIFVPELKTIIWGCGSYWGKIEKEEDLKEITTEEINNLWYVKLLKDMTSK